MNSNDLDRLIDAFMVEAQEFLRSLEDSLLEIEANADVQVRSQAVKTLFRAAHSLKGSAAMFGFEDLSRAAHCLEDCFAILRDRADLKQLNPALVTLLLEGVDRLKAILVTVQTNEEATDDHIEAIAAIEARLESEYGSQEQECPVVPTFNCAVERQVLQAIFSQELPPVLNQLEVEISQAQPQTLPQTIDALLKIYRQLSGLAGMLQLPEFGAIALDLAALTSHPQLTVELLQIQGWAIAQNLQTARTQILQGQAIAVAPVERSSLSDSPESESLSQGICAPVESDPTFDACFANEDLLANSLPELEVGATFETSLESSDLLPEPRPELLSRSIELVTHPDRDIASTQPWQRATIRVEVEQLNRLVNLVGELVINRTNLELQEGQLRSEVKRLRQKISTLHQTSGQLREDYDRMMVPVPMLSHSKAAFDRRPLDSRQSKSATVDFDVLELDRYTEFHTTAQSMLETNQAIAESGTIIDEVAVKFDRTIDQLRQIAEQLRSRVMQLQVVPFSQVVDRLPRAVRDLSRTYNKEANLLLLGRETQIDRNLLEALRDPLVHLVRNAFDHGIEPTEIRQHLGKPPSGQIEIEARHQGGQTIITVKDDGRGIDPEAIRSRIVETGLVSGERASELSRAFLYEFLFQSGFSTKRTASDLSGRGVGLDVVRANLQRVRGSIKVESQPGKGTSFILKLPLMLAIDRALLVKSDRHTVAIPLDAVEEILQIQASQIHIAGNQPMLRWRDEFIRLLRLPELLHYNIAEADDSSPEPIWQERLPVLVLTSGAGTVAIAVERLLAQQEIVVKPLPKPLRKPYGVVGSTILGDGRVVTILDVDDLINPLTSQSGVSGSNNPPRLVSPAPVAQPQILVVDDAYTIRQLLSLTLTRARYRVVQAKDGQEALEQLQNGLHCDLVIADLEMPRMDGFELVRSLKSNPQLARIPLAMLTSRSGSKHRQMALDLGAACYFTKPYQEAQLLDAIAQLLGHQV